MITLLVTLFVVGSVAVLSRIAYVAPARGPMPAQDPISWRPCGRPGGLAPRWRPGGPLGLVQAGVRAGDPAGGDPQPAGTPGPSGPGPDTGAAAAPYHASGLEIPARQPNGVAVAGMVLGILAVVFEWFGLITLALAIAAVVLGAVGASRSAATGTGHRQGVIGIVLGIIGLAAYLFWGAISAGILWLI
jgi:hypothetical protein